MKTVNIFDCDVACMTLDETVKEVEAIIQAGVPVQHVVLNANKVVLMQEDPKLKKIIQECGIINADGQSLVWASKLLRKPLPERVTGIDLMYKLVEVAAKNKYRVYFFGAKQEVVSSVVDIYKSKYPDLLVTGYRNGYFNDNDEEVIVRDIRNSQADILFVAFSSPKKEHWLSKHMSQLGVPFCMGVGGSFDVVAGITKRAPLFMQKTGLEWFYRFLQEPGRMWKRYLVGNSKFLYYTFKEVFRGKDEK